MLRVKGLETHHLYFDLRIILVTAHWELDCDSKLSDFLAHAKSKVILDVDAGALDVHLHLDVLVVESHVFGLVPPQVDVEGFTPYFRVGQIIAGRVDGRSEDAFRPSGFEIIV